MEIGFFPGRWYSIGLIGLVMVLVAKGALLGQVAPCDGAAYLITSNTSGSTFQKLLPDPNYAQQFIATRIPLSEPTRRITCLGYNVNDGFFYGLDLRTRELLRLTATGEVTNLGVPQNLNTTLEYYAGTVDALGRTLIIVGRNPTTGNDQQLFTINLNRQPYYAGSSPIISDGAIALTDLAIDPTRGVLYGFDSRNRRLVTLGGSVVSTYQFASIASNITSLFFDRAGNLFGYGSSNGGEFSSVYLRINKLDGKATQLGEGTSARDSDACSCPYTLEFTKTIQPDTILPCSEVTIEYQIENNTGTSWLGLGFRDELPLGFTIQQIEKMTSALRRIESGLGSNRLEMSNMDLLLEKNTIRIRVQVDEVAGAQSASQAQLQGLPQEIGKLQLSDNPATPGGPDPTGVAILTPEKIRQRSRVRFSCNGDTAIITPLVTASQYAWSTGSNERVLRVTRPGRYTLQATTDCSTYVDTVDIGPPPPVFAIELGADRQAETNDQVTLAFSSNGYSVAQQFWKPAETIALNCTDCPQPSLTARQSGWIRVRAQNTLGCWAQDSVFLEVAPVRQVFLPNVFSPNGDGVNDTFWVQGPEGSKVIYFQVYDRWGGLIFEKKDAAINELGQGWTGAGDGVFFYQVMIEFPDRFRKRFQGSFTVAP